MANPVVHWEIAAKNGQQLQDFYSKLFDWKITVDPQLNYGMVNAGDGGINGGIFQTQGEMPAYVTIYVNVDDLQAYLDKAGNLGARTLVPPTDIPSVGSFALFSDPEGNTIGLFKCG
jgi:predicted enzyme related to lactoylglutathione lyase